MIVITKDGKPVSRSQNLRGQLAYAAKSPPVRVVIRETGGMGCRVTTDYCNGATVTCEWASFDVAVDFYRRRSRSCVSWYGGLILTPWPMQEGWRVIAFVCEGK